MFRGAVFFRTRCTSLAHQHSLKPETCLFIHSHTYMSTGPGPMVSGCSDWETCRPVNSQATHSPALCSPTARLNQPTFLSLQHVLPQSSSLTVYYTTTTYLASHLSTVPPMLDCWRVCNIPTFPSKHHNCSVLLTVITGSNARHH